MLMYPNGYGHTLRQKEAERKGNKARIKGRPN